MKRKDYILLSLIMRILNGARAFLWVFLISGFSGFSGCKWIPGSINDSLSEKGLALGVVKRENLIQKITIAGTVQSNRSTVITAPYNGYIKKIYTHLGQKVQLGEPLVSVVQSLQAEEQVFPLRAPFAGIVTQLLQKEGQAVKQNDEKDFIMRIDDLTQMFLLAEVPEIEITLVKAQLNADIKLTALPDVNFHGVVQELAQSAMQKDRFGGRAQANYQVVLSIKENDRRVKPGMSAIADLIVTQRDQVLTLPHEYVQKDKNQYYVKLKNGEKKNVSVGLQNESLIEIVNGLQEGDQVLPADFLLNSESP